MKIYKMIKIDMATGQTMAEESFEYAGPLVLVVDGVSGYGDPGSAYDNYSSTGPNNPDTTTKTESNNNNRDENEDSDSNDSNGPTVEEGPVVTDPWGHTYTTHFVTLNNQHHSGNASYSTVGGSYGTEINNNSSGGGDSGSGSGSSGSGFGSGSNGWSPFTAPGKEVGFHDLFSDYLQNSPTAQFATGLFAGGTTGIAPGGFLVNPFGVQSQKMT